MDGRATFTILMFEQRVKWFRLTLQQWLIQGFVVIFSFHFPECLFISFSNDFIFFKMVDHSDCLYLW